MIKVAIYSCHDRETKELRHVFAVYSIQNTWADMDIRSSSVLEEWISLAEHADILICDVSQEAALSGLKKLKRENPSVLILPIADTETPPVRYVCPEIMPVALLWRPLIQRYVCDCIAQVMRLFRGKNVSRTDLFEVTSRKMSRYISYADIFYFEARDKKLILRTEFQELSFRGTLGELEERLTDGFIRCHKSFLVNRQQITGINRQEQMIELAGKVYIPLSRKYKKSFLEAFDDNL
ncbi:MAG: LytTR family transcriptional regulator DNA-binding domain-containing protein [Lachnospiraceae bacterium]|nr:LytTR family transcriptional regulator DNA-binding domain-containing protein [Lachnospiraceae bacterium]